MAIPTFTDEQAELLARGYPHLISLVDDHPDDQPKKCGKATQKLLRAIDPIYFVKWPRQVALRFVWAVANHGRKSRVKLDVGPVEAPPLSHVAPWIEKVIARGTVDRVAGVDYYYEVQALLFILEALHGTDAVLKAAVAAYATLAKIEAKQPRSKNYAASEALIGLGALLLRATPAAAKAARATLQKLVTPKLVKRSFVFEDLERLLGGKKIVERDASEFVYPVSWLFQSDGAFALASIRSVGGDVMPDVRGVWLAGPDAIDAYLQFIPKVSRTALPFVIESFGMLKTPRVIPMMQALANKTGGQAAGAWLAQNAKQLAGGTTSKSRTASKPKRTTLASAERELDTLTAWLVGELSKVRGKQAREAKVLRQAATRYMEIRSSVDEPATDYLGHFFMVDGVGLAKDRTPAWELLAPSEAESERWGKILGAAKA